MPDPSAADRSTPESPAAVAAVLEGAADQLLVNGRSPNMFGDHGEMCVIAATAAAAREHEWSLFKPAINALNYHLAPTCIVSWNWDTEDDDEVRDTLLLVAKELRGMAVAS